MTTSNHANKRPWYVKKIWTCAICLVAPFIGWIHVLWHRNHWQDDERHIYLLITAFMSIFWVVLLFPYWISVVTLALLAVALVIWPVES